jgi:phage terminase small subunit
MTKLTVKQRRFIEAYVGKAFFNATKAAKLAGYPETAAYAVGAENLKKPQIKAEVDRLLSERSMGADEVLQRLGQVARNEAAQFIDPVYRSIDLQGLKDAGLIHLVKGIKQTAHGTEIVLMDPQSALELLARHHGLMKDKVEVSGPGGGPLALNLLGAVDAAELQRRVEAAKHDLAAGGVPTEP